MASDAMGRWPWLSGYTWIRWNAELGVLVQHNDYGFKRSTSPGSGGGFQASTFVPRDVQTCWSWSSSSLVEDKPEAVGSIFVTGRCTSGREFQVEVKYARLRSSV